jgi:hypothetical protein
MNGPLTLFFCKTKQIGRRTFHTTHRPFFFHAVSRHTADHRVKTISAIGIKSRPERGNPISGLALLRRSA